MTMRVSKLLREANIGFSAFCAILSKHPTPILAV